MPKCPVVDIVLTNRVAQVGRVPDELHEQLSKFWSYFVPGAHHMPQYRFGRGKNKWDGHRRLMNGNLLPAGLFRATRGEAAEKLGIRFKVSYERAEVGQWLPGLPDAEGPYGYQDTCVDAMLKALPRGGGIVLAGTGTGKTATAARFFAKFEYSCIFIVDQLDLLHQTQEELQMWLGERVGMVGEGVFAPERVTVATIQTLKIHQKDRKFRKWYYDIDIVVVDELHTAMASRNFRILELINPIACFGLTATLQLRQKPIRMKAYSFCGPVIFTFPYEEGRKVGVLTKGKVLQLLFPCDPITFDVPSNATKTKAGMLQFQSELREHVLENEAKADACFRIVDAMVRLGKYVVVLVDRVTHLESISALLDSIPHRVAFGGVSAKLRRRARARFEKGKERLLVANRVFKKGINLKRVDVMVDMAELGNRNDPMQKFGRGVRLHVEKDEFLYIDFGTFGEYRFSKTAKRRASIFRKEKVPVKVVKVETPKAALQAVLKQLTKGDDKR